MKINVITALALSALLFGCSGGESNQSSQTANSEASASQETSTTENAAAPFDSLTDKGVGPISSVEVSDNIDKNLSTKGEELFKSKCTACHNIEKKLVGPALKGVTIRRTPEWIMNMILNPENMVKEDPIAKDLLSKYSAPMANQSLTQDEARAILEYLRTQK